MPPSPAEWGAIAIAAAALILACVAIGLLFKPAGRCALGRSGAYSANDLNGQYTMTVVVSGANSADAKTTTLRYTVVNGVFNASGTARGSVSYTSDGWTINGGSAHPGIHLTGGSGTPDKMTWSIAKVILDTEVHVSVTLAKTN